MGSSFNQEVCKAKARRKTLPAPQKKLENFQTRFDSDMFFLSGDMFETRWNLTTAMTVTRDWIDSCCGKNRMGLCNMRINRHPGARRPALRIDNNTSTVKRLKRMPLSCLTFLGPLLIFGCIMMHHDASWCIAYEFVIICLSRFFVCWGTMLYKK